MATKTAAGAGGNKRSDDSPGLGLILLCGLVTVTSLVFSPETSGTLLDPLYPLFLSGKDKNSK